MATGGTKTTKTRQARVIVELLSPVHRNQEAACQAANVPVRTLHNWLNEDPAFVAQLREAEAEAISEAVRRLVSVAPAAVGVLVGVMADKENAPGVRVRAAGQVLDTLVKLRDLHDVDRRLAALEQQRQ